MGKWFMVNGSWRMIVLRANKEPGGLPGSCYCCWLAYGTLVVMTSCGWFDAASRLWKLMFAVEAVVTARL
jgi:hypothetical protein